MAPPAVSATEEEETWGVAALVSFAGPRRAQVSIGGGGGVPTEVFFTFMHRIEPLQPRPISCSKL